MKEKMSVTVVFEKLPDVKINHDDLPELSDAIERCWFVYQVKTIDIN